MIPIDLRITENSRLAMAAAAITVRMMTLNRAREFWPCLPPERSGSTSDDMIAD